MNRNAPPSAPVQGNSSRRLILVAVLALLLIGGAVGLKVWLGGSPDKKEDSPDPTKKSGSVTQRSACSDYDDPKELEPLEFGKPIEVRFERRFLDALADREIPEIERYPDWQPKGLMAVLGEHRMRGSLFALHPDGKTVAVSSGDAYIRFGGLDILHEKFILTCPGSVRVLAWSPDGDRLAVSCGDGLVRLFDVRDLANVPPPVVLEQSPHPITSLSFSGDGKYLLGGDSTPKTGSAWVWNLKSRKIGKPLKHVGPVTSVAFSPVPGDYRALTGGGAEDGQLHLWENALTGKETAIDFRSDVKGKVDTTTYLGEVGFSRDGKRAFSCHSDAAVRLWDLANFKKGKETAVLRGHAGCPTAAFSPDGRYVASGRFGDSGVWLWNASDGKQVRRLATTVGIYALRFLPDGDRLVFTGTMSTDANVHVHEVATGKELLPPVGHLAALSCVALSPEGRHIASGAGDQTLRLWDLDGVKQRHVLGASGIWGVGFQPDGKRVFYWGASWATLPFADVASGQTRTPTYKTQHGGAIQSAALTRDGRYAVTGGHSDGSVRMWRLADGLQVRLFALGQVPSVVTVAPDMPRAVCVGGGKTRLLHLRCQQVVREGPPAAWAPFLPDGRAVLCGGAEAPAWKISADKVEEAGRFKLNLTGLSQGALSADGKRVAAILRSGRVAVFELETGEQRWTWTPPAHFYGVRGVALSADGGHLLTANGDGTVYIIRLP
jgi:WD40 repeat protein